jgi:tetratricopeptide (TPR) repeat protein
MPNNDEDPRSQPKFWIGEAAALLASGDEQKYAAALACAHRAVNMAPRSADALHILGLILFKTEKYSEAELWLREARSIDQDSASIALDLASTKYAMGDLIGSVEVFEEAIARAPDESTQRMLRTHMAHPILALGDYARGFALREGRELQATQQRFKKKIELEGRRVVSADQPLSRLVLRPPPRDRKAELKEKLRSHARSPAGYSYTEIIEAAKELEKERLHPHLIKMARLLAENNTLMLHPAAAIVYGEPSSSTSSAVKVLVRYFKEAAQRCLSNRATIDGLFVGQSPSFVKKFTVEDHLNFALTNLDRRRPGYLREVCSKRGRGRPRKR